MFDLHFGDCAALADRIASKHGAGRSASNTYSEHIVINRKIAVYNRSAVADNVEAAFRVERCQDYCRSTWGSEGVVFDDSGISGFLYERPNLQNLMTRAATGATRIIVVRDMETLGRDIGKNISLLEILRRYGTEVHSATARGPIEVAGAIGLFAVGERGRRANRKTATITSKGH